jgi:hypothetical protein
MISTIEKQASWRKRLLEAAPGAVIGAGLGYGYSTSGPGKSQRGTASRVSGVVSGGLGGALGLAALSKAIRTGKAFSAVSKAERSDAAKALRAIFKNPQASVLEAPDVIRSQIKSLDEDAIFRQHWTEGHEKRLRELQHGSNNDSSNLFPMCGAALMS